MFSSIMLELFVLSLLLPVEAIRNYVAQSSSYVVETTLGTVQGGPAFWPHEDYVNTYLGLFLPIYVQGIPYAVPPVGSLRFSPPQPAQAWSGTRQATTWSPIT